MSVNAFEETKQIMLEAISRVKSKPDVESILKINECIKQLSANRERIIEASHESLLGWTRRVEKMKAEAQRPGHFTEENYQESVDSIEKDELNLSKEINSLESQIQDLEKLSLNLHNELSGLKKINNEPQEPSKTELRLRLYRSLGISVLDDLSSRDPREDIKIRILTPELNDIHTLSIDESKYSDFFYTNYIWEMCSP